MNTFWKEWDGAEGSRLNYIMRVINQVRDRIIISRVIYTGSLAMFMSGWGQGGNRLAGLFTLGL